MKNNELVKYEGGLLKRVGNAISVTNKLLSLHVNHTSEKTTKDKILAMYKLKKLVIEASVWHQEQDKIQQNRLDNETNPEIPFEDGKS